MTNPSWTLRFEIDGTDHAYDIKYGRDEQGRPNHVWWTPCKGQILKWPVYCRTRDGTFVGSFTKRLGPGVGNEEFIAYPEESVFCEECQAYEIMQELSQ